MWSPEFDGKRWPPIWCESCAFVAGGTCCTCCGENTAFIDPYLRLPDATGGTLTFHHRRISGDTANFWWS